MHPDGYVINMTDQWQNVDTSEHPFPSEIWEVKERWEVTVKVIALLPVIVVGTLANGTLICVIIQTKSLQTNTNLLIANTSIADLITCLVCSWMFLCVDLYQKYVLGPIGCRLDGFSVHALTLVAVFNLSVVSYDRVSALVFDCSGKLSRRVTWILMGLAWIFGIIVAAPLAYFRSYHERTWKNYLETYCSEDTAFLYPYWHVFSCLSVWLPLVIMAISYSTILRKLESHESKTQQGKFVARCKGRVARVLALIVLAFILCRVPFTALIIRRAHVLKETPNSGRAEAIYPLWYISKYLVLVNAAVNPLLYGCSSSPLRKRLTACRLTFSSICVAKRKQEKTMNVDLHDQGTRMSSVRPQLQPRSPCVHRDSAGERAPVSTVESISSRVSRAT